MLETKEIWEIAKTRLQDAQVLMASNRLEGAVYLCGYAVELGLKSRICRTLHWDGYPETNSEFRDYKSFRTHDLDVLLHLSGIEEKIRSEHLADWSVVVLWNPEARYQPIGKVSKTDAVFMLQAATSLLEVL